MPTERLQVHHVLEQIRSERPDLPDDLMERLAQALENESSGRVEKIKGLFKEFSVGERLRRIKAQAFRGVPTELDIDLSKKGRSLIVLGENGTGKSTIADALEWYFTGKIAYLNHEGRAEALKNMAASPETETCVEVETNGDLGGRAVAPDGGPAGAREAGRRETFLLRGRTLAEFIDRSKGEKWRVLAELLGLEAVDRVRLELQRVRNDLKKEARSARTAVKDRAAPIATGLEIPLKTLSKETLLAKLAESCRGAGLDAPSSFEALLDPNWAPATAEEAGASKATALSTLASELGAGGPRPDVAPVEEWNALIRDDSRPDAGLLRFLGCANEILQSRDSENQCPLCHQPVDAQLLQELVQRTLQGFQNAARELEAGRDQLRGLIDDVASAEAWRKERLGRAGTLGVTLPPPPGGSLAGLRGALDRSLPVDVVALAEQGSALQEWDDASHKAVREAIPEAPEPEDHRPWEIAVLAQQIREWNRQTEKAERAGRALGLADAVFGEYQERQGQYIQGVLRQISGRVAEIYEALHPGEGLGAVDVELWGDKGVELSVDFHGKRTKPPHGVLSESHLNSLAIALFLGMAETFNEKLDFLVLDDVVNSFDIGHRGQLAEVLAERFDDRQLIVLTHDPIFFQRVGRLAPTWARREFTSWSFEEGPRTTAYEARATLAQARAALDAQDTMGAGQKGRRALEEILQEICEGLSAPLSFRRGASNDHRELGELFKGLRRALKEDAKALSKELDPLMRKLEADTAAAFNVEAHASLGQAASTEVSAALARIEQFDSVWTCKDCKTRIWLKGTPVASRCRCGQSHFPPATVVASAEIPAGVA